MAVRSSRPPKRRNLQRQSLRRRRFRQHRQREQRLALSERASEARG
jgi:hypothetical protein